MSSNTQITEATSRVLKRLGEYKAMVTQLFPAFPRSIVNWMSIKDRDALALASFLDRLPREAVVLDIGTFVGVSAFHFASHPKVSEVVSVDSNPSMAMLNEWKEWGLTQFAFEPLSDMRVLDVAEAALARFPEQWRKVRLQAGTAASVSMPVFAKDATFVAFVDGDHSQEGVKADLEAVFDKNPYAITVLHDCRYRWKFEVLAGVASFTEAARTRYHFRMFEWLDPDSALPNLGVLYPPEVAKWVDQPAVDLLASSTSPVLQMAVAYRKVLEQQRARADRLKAELQEARRTWWRRIFRRARRYFRP